MSFREKVAWITLVTTLIGYGGYIILVGAPLASVSGGAGAFFKPVVAVVLFLVVSQTALIAVAAATDRKAARAPFDERERMITLHANRAGFYALQVGAFCALVTMFWWKDAKILAGFVLLAMAGAEVVRAGWQVASYRWSAR